MVRLARWVVILLAAGFIINAAVEAYTRGDMPLGLLLLVIVPVPLALLILFSVSVAAKKGR